MRGREDREGEPGTQDRKSIRESRETDPAGRLAGGQRTREQKTTQKGVAAGSRPTPRPGRLNRRSVLAPH